jgi:hypothetical protein
LGVDDFAQLLVDQNLIGEINGNPERFDRSLHNVIHPVAGLPDCRIQSHLAQ